MIELIFIRHTVLHSHINDHTCLSCESCHGKICLSEFLTRSDINWAVQPQKTARGLKFQVQEIAVGKTEALISYVVTAQLIRASNFAT